MVDKSRKIHARNGVETTADSDRIFWFNEKHIEGLDHKNLLVTAVKHFFFLL